ncbi:WD40/YVTN/BNR-like repeat-containing protein [Christiangramia aquimixticola]|uniref:WD40/YVTN/BNR-like repeat-containing protein n=1 Tax=Christiangramia aquimixticola TaxID=1697558 RepID=UPI003AA91DCC
MNKRVLQLLLVIFTISASSQTIDLNLLKNKTPRNIGPAGMSGRVTSIDVVTSNPDIMFVGTASGGLWKSTSGGIKWDPVFDDQVTASIGAVAIQQSNPSVIWVGTGEGNPRNSLNGGYGIFRSLDGGRSWKNMGLEKTRHIHRVIIHPDNPDIVYVAAIGSPWGAHEERGVYKTTDGGKTWKKTLYQNKLTGAADLVMDPNNPNKLIAAMWEHKREPWFFNSGGEGSGMFITHDGGETWQEKTAKDGLPKGELGRIGLAISASNSDIVYALVEAKKNALYKSEDGGFSWEMINDKPEIGNRPFYYSDIFVDPENSNRLYSVFTYVHVSEDGGKSFEELMPAYGVDNGIHPDHHAWWIHPTDGSFMMDGNDGGLNITHDYGKSWRFVANLPVAQFYHIAVDNEFPYNVYGGMQDNGSWRGPAYVWKDQGIRNSYWQEISFGDGFDVVPDKDDSRYGWSMSQQGYVSRYDHVTGNNYTVRPTHPDPKTDLRFNWNSAINDDPFDNNTLYFGSQFVHKSTDKGLTWKVISPDLTTNDTLKQKQMDSGGLTIDATGAENYTTILVIEPSPVEKGMLWVGTDDGKVHYTRDGGNTWNDVSNNLPGLPDGSWIVQIKASKSNKEEALLVANDYRRFNYEPYAYRTKNYGKTWERIVDSKDAQSYALSIIEDPEVKELMFLGTDDGLYVSFNAGKNWQKYTNGFPTVPVKDLVIHPRENDLVIGTFGRSAWVLDDLRPFRELATNNNLFEKKLELFTPPTAYHAAIQQPTGSRFGGDALFQGANRSTGARISYYINISNDPKAENKSKGKIKEITKPTEKELKKDEKDSLTLKIFDGERLIRTLKQKAPDSSGIYTLKWNLDQKGADRPSREIKENKSEPGGVLVKPGSYRLLLEYEEVTSEESITVKSDPRLDVSEKYIDEVYTTSKKLENMQQIAADAVKQLVESKDIAEKFEADLKKLPEAESEYESELKDIEEIKKEIEELIALYLGKEDDRQGITRNKETSVLTRLRTAQGYVQSRPAGITSTEHTLIKHAEDELSDALKATNEFYKEKWPDFQNELEKVKLPRFKDIKSFSLE